MAVYYEDSIRAGAQFVGVSFGEHSGIYDDDVLYVPPFVYIEPPAFSVWWAQGANPPVISLC
jgi:hypothetical protein